MKLTQWIITLWIDGIHAVVSKTELTLNLIKALTQKIILVSDTEIRTDFININSKRLIKLFLHLMILTMHILMEFVRDLNKKSTAGQNICAIHFYFFNHMHFSSHFRNLIIIALIPWWTKVGLNIHNKYIWGEKPLKQAEFQSIKSKSLHCSKFLPILCSVLDHSNLIQISFLKDCHYIKVSWLGHALRTDRNQTDYSKPNVFHFNMRGVWRVWLVLSF